MKSDRVRVVEHLFDELKRYVRFGSEDETALRELFPAVAPHFERIADEFYGRLAEHERARSVFSGPEQVERLKGTLADWMARLFRGPWDQDYYERRQRIGRMHVKVDLPQHYMLTAMNLIRVELTQIARERYAADPTRRATSIVAIEKILDLELAIMLDSYRESYVEKVQELERLEQAARARRAERLASLGTMAAGLAHEIRNPLNAAHLQLTLVQRRLAKATQGPEVEAAASAASLAATEMKRLAGLVEEFLSFARPQPLRIARGDLRVTAEVVVSLIGPEAAAAGVSLSLAEGEGILADYDDERMKQVLFNLIRNAVEATGRDGHVEVRLSQAPAGPVLEVADDGPGIPDDAPVFEPFFTTKEVGTGLGLAIVYRIVADHGGKVTYDSRPGRTVFRIELPQ